MEGSRENVKQKTVKLFLCLIKHHKPKAGEGEIFRTRPDPPWGPPRLLYDGYRVFPAGKAAGAWR